VRVIWTPEAELDRADVWDSIATDSPRSAARMDQLFSEAAARLADYPRFGRVGRIPGTRELVVHENYRLVYEIVEETVWILALVHAARRSPPTRE